MTVRELERLLAGPTGTEDDVLERMCAPIRRQIPAAVAVLQDALRRRGGVSWATVPERSAGLTFSAERMLQGMELDMDVCRVGRAWRPFLNFTHYGDRKHRRPGSEPREQESDMVEAPDRELFIAHGRKRPAALPATSSKKTLLRPWTALANILLTKTVFTLTVSETTCVSDIEKKVTKQIIGHRNQLEIPKDVTVQIEIFRVR
jgi:hypothetical protein